MTFYWVSTMSEDCNWYAIISCIPVTTLYGRCRHPWFLGIKLRCRKWMIYSVTLPLTYLHKALTWPLSKPTSRFCPLILMAVGQFLPLLRPHALYLSFTLSEMLSPHPITYSLHSSCRPQGSGTSSDKPLLACQLDKLPASSGLWTSFAILYFICMIFWVSLSP